MFCFNFFDIDDGRGWCDGGEDREGVRCCRCIEDEEKKNRIY